MRRALLTALLAICLGAVPGAVAAFATTIAPTRAQVVAALRRAERSRTLWATIDTCTDRSSPTVGIRGQIPALPFPARLVMVARVQEWSPTAHAYVPVTGSWRLGGGIFHGAETVQEGLRLHWSSPVTVIGHITFEWFRDHRLLGSTVRRTTAGHARVDGTHVSLATCSVR